MYNTKIILELEEKCFFLIKFYLRLKSNFREILNLKVNFLVLFLTLIIIKIQKTDLLMELKKNNNLILNNPSQNSPTSERKGILLDNLSLILKAENVFIIDFFHINSEKNDKTDLDIIKFYEIVKEYSVYDDKVLYLFLHSNKQMELIENTKALNNVLTNNIFIEDKIANVSLISGFCLAKNIPLFLFTDGLNQLGSWTKIRDPAYEKNLKISELDYFRITLDYMLKDKKRKYEQDQSIKANKSKLSKILEDSNSNNANKQASKEGEVKQTLKNILNQQQPQNTNSNTNNNNKDKNDFINKKRNNPNNVNNNQSTNNNISNSNNNNVKNQNNTAKNNNENLNAKINEKARKNEIEEYFRSYKFINFLNKIRKYIQANPPRNFEVLKNIIYHFTEQNIISINNNLKETSANIANDLIKPEELSFCIFKELLNKEFILSKKFYDLVNSNIVSTLDEISNILNFQINSSNISNNSLEEEIKNYSSSDGNNNNKNLIQVNSNANADKNKFSIGDNSEEEYKNLILNCQSVCAFVKNVVCKILNTIKLSSLEKLPTNPARYKNYIFAFVNNQELYKLSKKILNMDYNNIVNIITDGIVLEFMKRNLIVFISDKKIFYNLPEIEKEKFRLFKMKIPENNNNIDNNNGKEVKEELVQNK